MTSCLRWKPKVMCRGWWDWQPCLVISVLVTQSGWTLSYPVDCNSPGSSVHWILQARLLEWVTVPFSRGSSQPRDWIWLSRIAGRFFIIWATREVPSNTHTHTHTRARARTLDSCWVSRLVQTSWGELFCVNSVTLSHHLEQMAVCCFALGKKESGSTA